MIRTQSNLDRLRAACAKAIRPRPNQKLSEWAVKNFRFNPDIESTGDKYDLVNNPFWREPLDSFLDPDVERLSVIAGTQIGKTSLGTVASLGIAEIDPAPGMLVLPDQRDALQTRDRLYGNAEASTATRHMSVPEHKRNSRYVNLRSMRWHLGYAGGAQALRGKPCKYVFRHEVDVYDRGQLAGGDPLKASEARTSGFASPMIYTESTPRLDPSVIDDEYHKGDQRTWQCPCPKCGHHQELRFFVYKEGPNKGCGGVTGYLDENDQLESVDKARKKAKYICEKGCTLSNTAVKQMVLKGVWCPKGQRVNKKGKLVGTPEKSGRHRSYHLWRIHSPVKTLGDLVESYIDARLSNKMREFFENVLGRKYASSRKVPTWKQLGRKLERGYQRGTFPSEAFFLIGSADVQTTGVYWIVRAWGDRGFSWLVDWGFCPRYVGSEAEGKVRSDLAQLRIAMIDRYFETSDGKPNPFGRKSACPRLVGIDSNHRPRDVHSFIVEAFGKDSRRVRAVRGEHPNKPTDAGWKESEVDKPRRGGAPYPGGPRPLWNLYTTSYKESQLEKYELEADQPFALHCPSRITIEGEDYLKQITNEVPFEQLNKKTKRKEIVWGMKREIFGNHYWDVEIYNAVLADILLAELGLTWDASKWVKRDEPVLSLPKAEQVVAREYMLSWVF